MNLFEQVSKNFKLLEVLTQDIKIPSDQDWQDHIKGGEADTKKPSDFDQDQLLMGIKDEMEHTQDIMIATEIAMDHLTKDPEYYSKHSD